MVICPSVEDRQAALAASRSIEIPRDRVAFEDSAEGLVVHGLTELDLELAIFELRKSVPTIRQGKPQVAYDMGPPILEPYYRATIETPSENIGAVIGDMVSRRGLVQSARESAASTQMIADVPVSECFGYSTTLRALTQGRGRYSVEFLGYRSVPYTGPDTPEAA